MTGLLLDLHEKLFVIALLYARITPIFLIIPILNSGVLSGTLIRNAIIFTIVLALWPLIDTNFPTSQFGLIESAAMVLKEALVGASIGFVMALPFWIFNAMGAFIDVARGSSMGSLIDPTSGQESTEMQNFINLCVCVMYFELGGLKLLFSTLAQSFNNIGLNQKIEIHMDTVALFLTQVFEHGFVLAAPVLLTLLLSEALLGLLSRFTPQLSAFSVSMTIKSVIAIFIISLYFWQIAPDRLSDFMHQYSEWSFVKGVN